MKGEVKINVKVKVKVDDTKKLMFLLFLSTTQLYSENFDRVVFHPKQILHFSLMDCYALEGHYNDTNYFTLGPVNEQDVDDEEEQDARIKP